MRIAILLTLTVACLVLTACGAPTKLTPEERELRAQEHLRWMSDTD